MTTRNIDAFFRGILDIDGFTAIDSSLNGLQVDNDGSELRKIAFAVDANLETFKRAFEAGAGLLFVHHGLLWGSALPLRGNHRLRVQYLLDHNLGLYTVHLPLDQHPELGNNAGLAELLGIEDPQPFGLYHGRKLGYQGVLKEPLTVEDAVKRIARGGGAPLGVYPFGEEKNRRCAVVSGAYPKGVLEAMEEGIDLYVTGEASHTMYHEILEGRLNVISGGHYSTEVWGVRRVMERCAAQLDLELEFIDVPTGL
jgi:dinuclear metal center YbgI/SA1388 family protein